MSTLGAIKYKVIKRANPLDADAAAKWYAKSAHANRTVGFEDFVTHMSEHNSPYSRGVIHGVLIDMLSCLRELVLDGRSVRLGELGLFSVGVESQGAESEEGFSASLITGVHLLVRNTKTWSNAELSSKCRFERVNAPSSSATTEGPGGETVQA